jgi:hypothetical protein
MGGCSFFSLVPQPGKVASERTSREIGCFIENPFFKKTLPIIEMGVVKKQEALYNKNYFKNYTTLLLCRENPF